MAGRSPRSAAALASRRARASGSVTSAKVLCTSANRRAAGTRATHSPRTPPRARRVTICPPAVRSRSARPALRSASPSCARTAARRGACTPANNARVRRKGSTCAPSAERIAPGRWQPNRAAAPRSSNHSHARPMPRRAASSARNVGDRLLVGSEIQAGAPLVVRLAATVREIVVRAA